MAKRRKVVRVEARANGNFKYYLSCGHASVGGAPKPKAVTCRQCAL